MSSAFALDLPGAAAKAPEAAPAPASSLAATLDATPELSILKAALSAAGLTVPAGVTVFAPTNEAFSTLAQLLNLTAAELLSNTKTLSTVLKYHVLPEAQTLADFTNGEELETLLPKEVITVSRTQVLQKTPPYFGYNIGLISTGGLLPVAQIIKGDIETSEKSIVQIIDSVLIPATILS